MAKVHAIIPAGGEGIRLGGDGPKQLVEVAGRSILDWSISRLLGVAEQVVVAVPESWVAAPPSSYAEQPGVKWVAGGTTRWRSVHRAFGQLIALPSDLIAVHDAARPAVSAYDLAAVVEAARESGAAILGRAVSDTLKRLEGGRVIGTVDRSHLFRAETPQVFLYELLEKGFETALQQEIEPTDESALIELLGEVDIVAVQAGSPNPKLTCAADLQLVRRLLGQSA